MSERIRFGWVRGQAEMGREAKHLHVDPATLLALVEAVEAARTYRQKTGGEYAKPLDVALARFDFEERP